MKRTHCLSLLVLAVAALASAPPAGASRGVSIDVGRIAIRERLVGGGEYRLPTFGVSNPGTEPTTYRLTVTYVDGQQAKQPPESWFSFTPGELTLAGGESRPVQARLQIPADADIGDYSALIGPQIVGADAGPQVGAAAAARVTFVVEPSNAIDAWLRQLYRWLVQNPWLAILPVLVSVIAAWRFLRKRFTISVARRA